MLSYKKDFPIFQENPNLIFLDSAASSQKPFSVIQWVSDFTSKYYANIHRGVYSISEKSEEIYEKSKNLLSKFLNCKAREIFYTYNATYGLSILAQSLVNWKIITRWDKVLLWIREHHANVVSWQILAKNFWFEIEFINIDHNYEIDRDDFSSKYDKTVKVVSLWQVSNVTGKIYDMKKVKSLLRDDTFFMIDGSQSFPNMEIDVQDIWCDAFILTGHKMMAYTGIGAVYLKKDRVKKLNPMIAWGWTIKDVWVEWHTLVSSIEKFEAWTPNIIGAASLLYALEYIQSIWWIKEIQKHEEYLVQEFLAWFKKLENKVKLIWPKTTDRIAVFSFFIPTLDNFNNVWELFAEKNIAIRCGGHCAYPLHKDLKVPWTCRASAYLYNDKDDTDNFFEALKEISS